MEAAPLSAADVAAVTNRDGYGYGDGMGFGGAWIWVILIFAIFGFGGNAWGRNGNGLTQMELQQGFDTQSVLRKLDGINSGLCDGFYAMNTNFLQGQNQLSRDLCTGFSTVSSQVAENRFDARNCCCETNRNIDAVRYENARNTCDIVRAIEKDGQETRALINANVTQALRDKIVEQSQVIQSRDFQLSQQAQTANLVREIKPCPIPAYLSCSPYESNYYATRGYGYGYGNYGCGGCGCNNFA